MLTHTSPLERDFTEHQLQQARERQKIAGGRLEENIAALGFATHEELVAIGQEAPHVPASVQETGLDPLFLSGLLFKILYTSGLQTIPEIAPIIKLPRGIVEILLEGAKKDGAVEVRGATSSTFPILRYALTQSGKERAVDNLQQSQYAGPAPVPLPDYQHQVVKQTVASERISSEVLARILAHLILPPELIRQLGPAVNSNKPILLYGPSGNGKTSIAEALGVAFEQTLYLPHCIEVGGHIVKVFDEAVHEEVSAPPSPAAGQEANGRRLSLQRLDADPRWVRCKRPVVISGGELTLDALDLRFDPVSRIYEAPLQVKTTGGVFVIDDFGRQLVSPQDLLNRWIVPLEKQIDYLTLHTGTKFSVPFDTVLIFSTNLSPSDLMDPAFLRRIQYKLHVPGPSVEDYTRLFGRVCKVRGLELRQEVLPYLLDVFYPGTKTPLAGFHPKFIVEHVIAECDYEGAQPQLTLDRVKRALLNLSISDPSQTE